MERCRFDRTGLGLDRDRDPVAWNEAWERHLDQTYRPLPSYPDFVISASNDASVLTDQDVLAYLDGQQKHLCAVQLELARLVEDKRITDHLESKWLNMAPGTRQAYLLKGLTLVCDSMATLEDQRCWCPETTIESLEEGNGRGFVNLLATVCPQGLTELKLRPTPIFVHHPVFEAIHHIGELCPPADNKAARDIMQQHVVMARNWFLTWFLMNTVAVIYGIANESRLSGSGESEKPTLKRIRNLSPISFDTFITEMKDLKELAKGICASCNTLSSQLSGNQRFMKCTKCAAIGRTVLYCNGECQSKDWKKGVPPHKQICGKILNIPAAVASTPIATAVIEDQKRTFPPPDPGFVRSNALLKQLLLLHENPGLDYVVIPPGEREKGALLPDRAVAETFRIILDVAIKNGDPRAVSMLFLLLEDGLSGLEVSKKTFQRQLSEEYGVDPDTIAKFAASMGNAQDPESAGRLSEMLTEMLQQNQK